MRPRLKYLEISQSRHGKTVVYFRRGDGPRVRLPEDTGSNAFRLAYDAALAGKPVPHVRHMPVTKAEDRKQRTEKAMRQALRAAATRSRKRGWAFDLDLDWLLEKAEAQGYRCALTGIEFYAAHTSRGKLHPYTPSIDRIDAREGYTRGNVRIIIFALNMMLLDWGEGIFEQVANSYRYWQRTGRGHPIPAPVRQSPRTLPQPIDKQAVESSDGAVEKTRTSTRFPPQRPQRCASTNSATTAFKSPAGRGERGR